MAKKEEVKAPEDLLREVQAEADRILRETKETAAKILSAAEGKATQTYDEIVKQEEEAKAEEERTAKEKAYWGELVDHEEFYDTEKYKDDVFVGWNGKGYLIKRGETVKIPRAVKQILEDSKKQNNAAANMISDLKKEYEQNRDILS